MKRTVTSFFDKEYLEYAKYVVENRAIPSCIDGLHREKLFILQIRYGKLVMKNQ